jgi:hypothetical protein
MENTYSTNGFVPPAAMMMQYVTPEPPGDPNGIIAGQWTNKLMICPSDPQPGAAHSYLFNEHLVENQQKVLKYAGEPPLGQSSAEVVVLGEKRSIKDDYYMESGDFPTDPSNPGDTHVELYRHGVKLGSNYLYKDMHAENKPPQGLSSQVDPWDTLPDPVATTGT